MRPQERRWGGASGYTWAGDELVRLEVLRNVVKSTPGLGLEAIQALFVKGGGVAKRNIAIAEALEAMRLAGVVVQLPDGRWF